MRTLFLALALVSCAWTVASAQGAWREFSSDEGLFSALMPGEPQTTDFYTQTRKGVLRTRMTSALDDGLNEYSVSWTDYGPGAAERKARAETFDKIRDALLLAYDAKLLGESSGEFEGHASRAFAFSTADGRVIRARFFFAGDRFYQLTTQTRVGKGAAADGERFMNSFKLLPGVML